MVRAGCPVYTRCVGKAYSMGSMLLVAGAPQHRSALPNASIMIHSLSYRENVSSVLPPPLPLFPSPI